MIRDSSSFFWKVCERQKGCLGSPLDALKDECREALSQRPYGRYTSNNDTERELDTSDELGP